LVLVPGLAQAMGLAQALNLLPATARERAMVQA
jgi:hypothetical protein